MADLPAFAPDGSPVYIPEAQAQAAQAQGYRIDAPALAAQQAAEAEAAKYDSPGLAALAGAGRGLTFGLSDQVLTGSGLAAPGTLKGLRDYNPTASTVGEVAGMVAPALLTDGASLEAEGSLLTKFGRAASAPLKVLGEGAEGAAAASGLGRLGQAAVRGAAEGAAFQVGNNVSDSAIEDHPLTASALFHDVGSAALFGGVLGGAVDKAVGAVAEHAPAMLQRADDALERLAQRAELGAEAPGIRAALKDSGKALDEVVTHLEAEAMPVRVRQLLQDAPPTPGFAEMLAVASKELPGDEMALARASRRMEEAADLAGQHAVLSDLAAKVKEPEAKAAVEQMLQAPTFGPAAEYRASVSGVLQPVRAAQEAALAAAPAERAAALEAYQAEAKKALETLQETTYRHTSGPTVSLDGLREALAKLHPDAPATAARESGSLLEQFGENAHLLHLIPGAGHLAPALGAVGAGVELARVAVGGQSATVARIARRAAEQVQAAEGAIRSALGPSAAKTSARVAVASASLDANPESVAKRVESVRALAATPTTLADRMATSAPLLGQHAPSVAAQVTATTARAAQYLASVAPKDPRAPGVGPSSPWLPSRTEAQAYARQERAVLSPLSVAADFARGVLTPDSVTAIRATHPDLYARMVSAAMDEVASRASPLPYRRQLQFDVLVGRPVSQAAQAAPGLAALQPPPPPQGRPPSASPAPDVSSQVALKGTPLAS